MLFANQAIFNSGSFSAIWDINRPFYKQCRPRSDFFLDDSGSPMLQIRRANRDNIGIISHISVIETVLMRGHNIYFP